jgi:hypothetical protein
MKLNKENSENLNKNIGISYQKVARANLNNHCIRLTNTTIQHSRNLWGFQIRLQ